MKNNSYYFVKINTVYLKILGIAVTINFTMGILYAWSLYLIPLENYLQVERSSISLVPSLALVTFTFAMMVHARIIPRLGRPLSALLAFGLSGGGHLLFPIFGSLWSLLVGYGLAFGFGAGLGYGLALSMVARVENSLRAYSIGIVMSAFAMTSVVIPIVAGPLIRNIDPGLSFAVIGVAMFAICLLVVINLRAPVIVQVAVAEEPVQRRSASKTGQTYLKLEVIFFLLCYVGLMAVSHATGILTSNTLPARIVDFGPAILTGGYLLGSLFGGRLGESLGAPYAIFLVSVLCGAGTIMADTSTALTSISGMALIGFTFGSTASLFPTVLGMLYGPEQIGSRFGRIMVTYGAAGLCAPWISGALFEAFGDYHPAFIVGLTMSLLAAALGITIRQRPAR